MQICIIEICYSSTSNINYKFWCSRIMYKNQDMLNNRTYNQKHFVVFWAVMFLRLYFAGFRNFQTCFMSILLIT